MLPVMEALQALRLQLVQEDNLLPTPLYGVLIPAVKLQALLPYWLPIQFIVLLYWMPGGAEILYRLLLLLNQVLFPFL